MQTGDSKNTQIEPRWHASLAVVAALGLYVTLPPKLTLGPGWVEPLLVLLLLVPLSILVPRRNIEDRRARIASIALIALVNFFNVVSVVLLIASFFHPHKRELIDAGKMMRIGFQIWATNVLVFGLWFWELDGGGPRARARVPSAESVRNADFLFPQLGMLVAPGGSAHVARDWKPQFLDYLYLAFTNSTAFSPTDTMPLSRLAKILMTCEAMIALVTIAIVLSRAISLI